MWWWEHKLGQIRVLLFLLPVIPRWAGFQTLRHSLIWGILSPTEHRSSTVDHNVSPFPYSHSPISKQQEAIRSCTCCISAAKICIRLCFSSHAGHRNVSCLHWVCERPCHTVCVSYQWGCSGHTKLRSGWISVQDEVSWQRAEQLFFL